jgi:hypothetical protein
VLSKDQADEAKYAEMVVRALTGAGAEKALVSSGNAGSPTPQR